MTGLALLLTFIGGGAGSSARYAISRLMSSRYSGIFPLATFLINITGCFALGFIASLLAHAHNDSTLTTAFLATGFLGGYTTFSTYALEAVLLHESGNRRMALASLVGSVAAGLLAAGSGAAVAALLGTG